MKGKKWLFDESTKRFIIHRLLLFMGTGVMLVFLIPFSFDLISIAGPFILTTALRK
jgi:hypothetical protein